MGTAEVAVAGYFLDFESLVFPVKGDSARWSDCQPHLSWQKVAFRLYFITSYQEIQVYLDPTTNQVIEEFEDEILNS